jgi:hypothetical protein
MAYADWERYLRERESAWRLSIFTWFLLPALTRTGMRSRIPSRRSTGHSSDHERWVASRWRAPMGHLLPGRSLRPGQGMARFVRSGDRLRWALVVARCWEYMRRG